MIERYQSKSYVQVLTPTSVRKMPLIGYTPSEQTHIQRKHQMQILKTQTPTLSLNNDRRLPPLPILRPQILNPRNLPLGKSSITSTNRVIHIDYESDPSQLQMDNYP